MSLFVYCTLLLCPGASGAQANSTGGPTSPPSDEGQGDDNQEAATALSMPVPACAGPKIGKVLFESVVWAGGANKEVSQRDIAASSLELAQSLFASYQIGLAPVCAHASTTQVRPIVPNVNSNS